MESIVPLRFQRRAHDLFEPPKGADWRICSAISVDRITTVAVNAC